MKSAYPKIALAAALACLAMTASATVYELRIATPGVVATPPPPSAGPALGIFDTSETALTALAFPGVALNAASAPLQVSLKNTGGAPFVFGASAFSLGAPFSVQSSTCAASLDPSTECLVTLSYTPTSSGAVAGTLTVNGTSVQGPTLPLTGTGLATSVAGTVTTIWSTTTGYFNLFGVSENQLVASGNCQSVDTVSMALNGSQLTAGVVNLANHSGVVTGELFAGKFIYPANGPVGQCYGQAGWPGAVGFTAPLNGALGTAASSFSSSSATTQVFSNLATQKLYGINNDQLVEFNAAGGIAQTFSGRPGNGWVTPMWRGGALYVFVPSSPSGMWKYTVNAANGTISYQGGSAGVATYAPSPGTAAFDTYGDLVYVDSANPVQLRRVGMANFPSVPASVAVQLKNPDGSLFQGGASYTITALKSNSTGLYALVRTNAGVTRIVRID